MWYVWGRWEMRTKYLFVSTEERVHCENLSVDGRIIKTSKTVVQCRPWSEFVQLISISFFETRLRNIPEASSSFTIFRFAVIRREFYQYVDDKLLISLRRPIFHFIDGEWLTYYTALIHVAYVYTRLNNTTLASRRISWLMFPYTLILFTVTDIMVNIYLVRRTI